MRGQNVLVVAAASTVPREPGEKETTTKTRGKKTRPGDSPEKGGRKKTRPLGQHGDHRRTASIVGKKGLHLDKGTCRPM